MVFPDGRCRPSDDCLEGTLFADSPSGHGQVGKFFLDLYDYVGHQYRARPPEDVEITE